MEELAYIKEFLINRDIFFEDLEEGNLNRDQFHKYTTTVYDLSVRDLKEGERCKCANIMWEIGYRIQSHLTWHYNQNDIYEIENFEEDDLRQLNNILTYMTNRFTHGKELKKELLTIGSWS
jgi:hypothetical protein